MRRAVLAPPVEVPIRPSRCLPLVTLLAACHPAPEDSAPAPRGAAPAVTPVAPTLKRLTATQYVNSVHDLLGADLLVPDSLEPDTEVNGLIAIGASVTSVSSRGVEQYETAAYSVAEQAMASSTDRAALVPCTPAATQDDTCASTVLAALGRRAWRRDLTADELARLVTVSGTAAAVVGDFHGGLVYGIAGLLQSPNFLYRVELGETDPDDPTRRRYTNEEMATRLAYFLWDTTPDDELLTAASAGELTTDAGLATQVDRMLADPRVHGGVRNFFTEAWGLYKLDDLTKDPTVYVHMSDEVGADAREETLLNLEWLVFDQDGDYRDIFTTRHTFLNRKLAAIYDVPAPARDGFGETELPADGDRRGLLGQVSFLALQAHPTTTSPTRRGLFIREQLLCDDLPPPPANVDTSIPEPSPDAVTMRDRLESHMADPYCASCHAMTDPIGLGFENYDGLGGWRTTDNGAPIDASGDLDGAAFSNASQLAERLHEHDGLGSCLTKMMFQYSQGRAATDADAAILEWHAAGLTESGYSVLALVRDLVMSSAFRQVGEVQ